MSGLAAVIDIGSNSILLLLAERQRSGALSINLDRAMVARLSQGAAASGRLRPEAIERALAVLREYAAVIAGAEVRSVRAVATEGVRMVENPDEFLRPAEAILGVPIEAISGDEEARLSYRSVALERPEGGPLRVIDIGGASTELVEGEGETITAAISHSIGSVRLTEQFVDGDPPTPASLHAVERVARDAFATQPLSPWPELYGLAGTVTTAAALLLGLEGYERARVDRSRFARAEILALRERLAAMTVAERATLPCLGPGRADVIVTGVTILLVAMEHCGAETLVVRDRGLRYALL